MTNIISCKKSDRPIRKDMKGKVLKKKKLIICCAAIVMIIAVALCLLFSCGSHGVSKIDPPSSSLSISRTPPEDGSAPEDYEGIDNIAYIIGRLAQQRYYHTEGETNVTASVLFVKAGQTVYSSKDYKDGILLTSAVSISNNAFAPSKAIQRFFGDGKAVVREAASPSSEWAGSDVEWKTGEPKEVLDKAQYEERYGLWASEFSDYVINEETVLDITPLEKTEDGNYTFTATLDNEDSTYYYKHSMVTMGDLDGYPVFSSVKLTFTFGADWTIYSLGINEEYTSVKGVEAACVGSAVINYTYEEEAVDVSDYEEYFAEYADAETTGAADKELTAADYLTYGFASFLTEEVSLDAQISAGGTDISAQLLLDMRGLEFNSLKGRIGSLLFAYEGDKIWLSYKDFSGYLNVSDALALFAGEGGSAGGGSLDTDALMEQLTNADLAKDGEKVTLSATLGLGGMSIPVRFGFIDREGDVSFDYIAAELDVAGIGIAANVTFADETVAVEVPETAVDLYPFVENIKNLVEGKKYELGLEYADESSGLSVKGNIAADLSGDTAVSGKVDISYAGLNIPAEFAYADGTVYLKAYNIKVSAAADEVKSAFGAILAAAGIELPEVGGIDVSGIVAAVAGLDFGKLIKEPKLTEDGFSLTVNADELLCALTGEEISLGDISAAYALAENKFTVAALGATLTFGANEGEVGAPADADTYVSVSRLTQFIKPVQNIIDSKGAAFEMSFDTVADGVAMTVSLAGEARADEGGLASLVLRADVTVGENTETLYISYENNAVAIGYGGYVMRVSPDDMERIGDAIKTLLAGSGLPQGTDGVMRFMETFDLNGLLDSLVLLSESENAVTLLADLSAVLGEGNEDFELTLSLLESGAVCAEVPAVSLFGFAAQNFSANVAPVPETCGMDTSFLQWTACDNVFEFILRAYDTLFDTNALSLSFRYEGNGMTADLRGAVNFRENDTEEESNVVIDLAAEAVIEAGGGKYYIQASVVGEYAYVYFSLKGFETSVYFPECVSSEAAPLRAKFEVSSLFDMSSDAMPLIVSLLGLEQDELYYFNFVVDLLGGSYDTINSDIFNAKDTQAWIDLILGIYNEYAAGTEGDAAAQTAEGGVSVSFSLQDKSVSIAGEGLNAVLAAGSEYSVSAPDTGKYPYTDYSSLADLFGVMMNSITTSETVEDDHGNQTQKAEINNYYYLSGTVSATFFGFNVANITLDAAINIEEDGGVAVDLRVHIPYTYILTSITTVINGNTLLEMTIEDGMVYICRRAADKGGDAESAQAIYRVMTLDNLFANFLDQMGFLFNFSSMVTGMLPDETGGTSSGTDIGNILTSYGYGGENGQKWTLGLDLSSFTDGVIAGSTVELSADGNGVLQTLTFGTSIYSVIGITATLGYMNPGESMNGDHFTDITRNVGEEARALFGGVISGTDWAKTVYLEGYGATLTYTADGETIGSQKVAYDAANGEIFTGIVLPDLSEYNKNGYTYSWGEIGTIGGDATIAAQKTANTYKVTLYSAYEIEGYEYVRTENGSFVYELGYTYGTRLGLPVGTEYAKTYEIVSFADQGGEKYSYIENILSDLVLEAEWSEIEYTVTYTAFGETVCAQTYGYGDAIELPDEYAVPGYAFAGWDTGKAAVESDMKVAAIYSVTVTLASDHALQAEGVSFTGNDEAGYFGSYTAEGSSEEDFAFALSAAASGYTQFGWWREADGAWTNVVSLAGLDGQTVWALWVTDFTAIVSSASKKDTSKLFAYKYDYAVQGSFAGGTVGGNMSEKIAEAIGLESSVGASGSVLYDGHSHAMTMTAAEGGFSATAYLTSNALYGNGYSYDFYYNKFNAYRLTVSVAFTCDIEGVAFGGMSVVLEGNF